MERDPTSVTAHHLENHHPIVRLRRRMQTIERLGGDIQRRDKTKRQFRAGEIVVDGLRNAANRNAAFVKLVRDRQRAFAAENHQRVDPKDLHVRDGFFVNRVDAHSNAVFIALDKTAAITRTENCSAAGQKSTHVRSVKRARCARTQQAFETVFDTDDAHAVLARGGFHHGANHRIQTRRITASSQNSYRSKHNGTDSLTLPIANCRLPILCFTLLAKTNRQSAIGNWQSPPVCRSIPAKWKSMTMQKR